MRMRAVVSPDGTIRAVYSDMLKGMNIGPMQVARASNVEFNEPAQNWEATTPEGELIAAGPSRDEVIKMEVAIIQARL